MNRYLITLLLVVGLSLGVAACGDSGGKTKAEITVPDDVQDKQGEPDLVVDVPVDSDTYVDIQPDKDVQELPPVDVDVADEDLPDTGIDLLDIHEVDIDEDADLFTDLTDTKVDVEPDTLDVMPDLEPDGLTDIEGETDVGPIDEGVQPASSQVTGGALLKSPNYTMKVVVGGSPMAQTQSPNYGLSVGFGALANQ